jgi:flagellin
MQADWPDVIISDTGTGVSMVLDPLADRRAGSGSRIGFSDITVSHEPIPSINFKNIDIVQNPDWVRTYINYMETATARVVDAAATLGALQTRIDMQAEFAARLAANIESGIGRLVDADMNEESTRLKALQTQQQLAIQALSISNTAPDVISQLFR